VIGQGPQHDAVDDAEHGGRRAKTEGNRENSGGGKARRATHQTDAIESVLPRHGKPGDSTCVARVFDHPRDGAKLALCRCARRLGRQPTREMASHQTFEMLKNLISQFTIDLVATQQCARTHENHPENTHGSPRMAI
jgi:hypothetical protein